MSFHIGIKQRLGINERELSLRIKFESYVISYRYKTTKENKDTRNRFESYVISYRYKTDVIK